MPDLSATGGIVVSPFILKLRHGAQLRPADEETLNRMTRPVRSVDQKRDLVKKGSEPRSLPIVIGGWACRYRLLENGKRQITALYLPGDLCEPFGVLPRFTDSFIGALTPAVFAQAPLPTINAAVQSSPRIAEALWWDLLVASSIDQERLVSLGRRSAAERVGHFFCELQVRLTLVGLATELGYDLAITQAEMSDLLGLTPVHVNRSLRTLREIGLISLQGRRLIIRDTQRLRELSYFDPSYLHMDGAALG